MSDGVAVVRRCTGREMAAWSPVNTNCRSGVKARSGGSYLGRPCRAVAGDAAMERLPEGLKSGLGRGHQFWKKSAVSDLGAY